MTRFGKIPVEDIDRAPDPVEMIEVPGEAAERRIKGVSAEVPGWHYSYETDTPTIDDSGCPRGGQVQDGDIYPWWHISECRKSIDRENQEPWEWLLMARIGAARILRYDPEPPPDVLADLGADIERLEILCREIKPVTAPDPREG